MPIINRQYKDILSSYSKMLLTEESTTVSSVAEAKLEIIKKYLERKLGITLSRYGGPTGVDVYDSDGQTRKGIKYIFAGGKMRFNISGSTIESLTVWQFKKNSTFSIKFNSLSVVSSLPAIVEIFKDPQIGTQNVSVPFKPEEYTELMTANSDIKLPTGGVKTEAKEVLSFDGKNFEKQKDAVDYIAQKYCNGKEPIAYAFYHAVKDGIITLGKNNSFKGATILTKLSVESVSKADMTAMLKKEQEKLEADSKLIDLAYKTIEVAVTSLVKASRPEKWAVLIYGSAGSGKTTIVERILKEQGKKEGIDYELITGQATPRGIFDAMKSSSDKILVFDDCDSALKGNNPALEGIMKGALNTKDKRTVKWLKSGADADETEFDFTGKVIFITNLEKDQVPEALVSRSSTVRLVLDNPQMIARLEKILPSILPDVAIGDKKTALEFIKSMSKKYDSGRIDLRTLGDAIFYLKSGDASWKDVAEYSIFQS